MRTCVFVVAGLLCISSNAIAASIGPYVDLKDTIPAPDGIEIDLPTEFSVLWKGHWHTYHDRIHITITFDPFHSNVVPVKGLAYQTDNNDPSGNVVLTTIYGLDPDPSGTGLEMTGFDLSEVPIEFSDEQFFGESGAIYPAAPLGARMLSELPGLFPELDLSSFEGDPSSIVYAFQTTVPLADFVPEPSTLALAGIGAIALLGFAARRRFA